MRARVVPTVERASPDDLMLLACDVGPAPMQVGAVLILDAGPEFDIGAAQAVIGERVEAVPRLRQRLVRPPIGCGCPVWIDDAAFDVSAHVRSVACPPPGDDVALLATAVTITTEPLPWSRPLWSATFVSGLAGARMALVVVFHHVLADGIGGLAVLASLADGAPKPVPAAFPRPGPSRRQLAADAIGSRLRAVPRSTAALRGLGAACAELNPAGAVWAARTTLNGPTGPGRRMMVTRADLGQIRAIAHAHGATLNDVVLTTVARALRSLLAFRGESLDCLDVSVMVTGRDATAPSQLGNLVGVMSVRLPARGDRDEQLEQIAAITRAHKTVHRGASAGLLRPAFRTVAGLGLIRWFINHQRFVSIFVTNLRGPDERLRFAGAAITDVLPVTLIAGNVTLSFGILSYAGRLVVVIVADPERNPDLDVLASALQSELDAVSSQDRLVRGSVAHLRR